MREDDAGRGTVFPWGNPPAAPGYAVGEPVYSGSCRGTVVSVDGDAGLMQIVWSDGHHPITYPLEADYLRKAMPWE